MQRHLRTTLIPLGIVLVAAIASGCALVSDPFAALGRATPEPTDVAAPRPEATLIIAQPPAGATLPSGKVTVAVTYNGPSLVAPARAEELNQYHLHYFLDVDAGPYLKSSIPVPLGNLAIVHSSATQVSFDNVAPGTHQLTVVLAGGNHVAVNPPIAQQISFTVKS